MRFLAALPLLITPCVFAAHPLVTDDTGTQRKSGNQVELSTDWATRAEGKSTAAEFTYTRGLTDNLDLFVSLPGITSAPRQQATGLNDLTLGAKWRLIETDLFSFGIKPEWSPATANAARGLGNGKDSFSLALMGQMTISNFTLLINQSHAHNRFKDAEVRDQTRSRINQTSAALLYALKEDVTLVADIGQRDSDANNQTSKTRFGVVGVIWAVSESLDLDFGMQRTKTPAETERQFGVGLTWRFK